MDPRGAKEHRQGVRVFQQDRDTHPVNRIGADAAWFPLDRQVRVQKAGSGGAVGGFAVHAAAHEQTGCLRHAGAKVGQKSALRQT